MKKILVIPNSLKNLGSTLKKDITGVILPLEHLSVNNSITFSLDDIKSIINLTSKEVCVMINKIMHNSDLKNLELTLVSLNKMNVSKIFFYDISVLAICKRLDIKKDLVIFQDHLNASIKSNLFYRKRGVKYSLITNDITKEEINDIASSMPLMLMVYGYLPIFYSRRYLITNYLNFMNLQKEDAHYYIKHKEDKYPIVEEENGTTIYTKEPINLINEIDFLQVDYLILNANLIQNEEFQKNLDDYINCKRDDMNHYQGFLNKKTVYKVGDYDKK